MKVRKYQLSQKNQRLTVIEDDMQGHIVDEIHLSKIILWV